MTVYQDIRGSLQARARLVGGLPSAIAIEGMQFSPTTGVPFVAFKLHPTSEKPKSIGPSGMTLIEGLFLIDVSYPSKQGTGLAEEMADLIKAIFQPGITLTQNSTALKILYAQRGPTLEDADWVRVPVTIGWYSYVPTVP